MGSTGYDTSGPKPAHISDEDWVILTKLAERRERSERAMRGLMWSMAIKIIGGLTFVGALCYALWYVWDWDALPVQVKWGALVALVAYYVAKYETKAERESKALDAEAGQ